MTDVLNSSKEQNWVNIKSEKKFRLTKGKVLFCKMTIS